MNDIEIKGTIDNRLCGGRKSDVNTLSRPVKLSVAILGFRQGSGWGPAHAVLAV